MNVEQRKWTEALGWTAATAGGIATSSQLVLVFGAAVALRRPDLVAAIRQDYPAAYLLGCSTAGEICGTQVLDDSLVVTAVHFEHTLLRSAEVSLTQTPGSFEAGEWIGQNLPRSVRDAATGAEEKLAHVLVLTDGLKGNGSDFVSGVMKHLPEGVTMTGGLAGDGARFGETQVFRNSAPETGTVAALGLYKQYLGEHADGLPATGLLFPLSVRTRAGETPVVRTILSVDDNAQSLTFAGDVPEGSYARLMKANFDRLIDGATGAARTSYEAVGSVVPDLAILISCVGRKLVLKQRVEEEVEAVSEVLGTGAVLAGFYSYGEISPFTPGAKCELHNQTMTITTLSER